ncbi:hypothetical protein BEL07_01125 [Mycolicibacterium grossiae]|uniref:Uncharacterized protein n=1 Tax=Mycolicibacterium grossiae TaxID=1552759 RepID=A0A1E8QAD1_9MYCO|nr:hypothetical protein BEL07_01125 [Mycolicibacterium grossiae]
MNLDLETSADWTGGSGKRHVITTGTVEAALDGVTVLTPVNPDIGASWGRAALLTYDESEVVGVDWLPLSDKPPAETVEVDVSDLRTTDQLLAAVDRAIAVAPEWSVIRLAGELSQGVMLPTTAEHVPPRADVAIHTDDVHFGFAAPDKSDHTALAEFVRSLSDADVAPRTRHQAIALGIAALDPTYALVNES